LLNAPPELPRALALVVALGVTTSQPAGNLTIQEIIPQVATWNLPQPLPAINVVAILVGGMGIYSTEFRVTGPDGRELGRERGPDAAFTTQIRRFNMFMSLTGITGEPVVAVGGTYHVDLYIREVRIASTPLEITALPGPPPGVVVAPVPPTA
jgi:hypothetical protein